MIKLGGTWESASRVNDPEPLSTGLNRSVRPGPSPKALARKMTGLRSHRGGHRFDHSMARRVDGFNGPAVARALRATAKRSARVTPTVCSLEVIDSRSCLMRA